MFFETIDGRLQNATLLQEVVIVKNEDETYSIGYVQINGEVIKEGNYNTLEDAETVKESIETILLSL